MTGEPSAQLCPALNSQIQELLHLVKEIVTHENWGIFLKVQLLRELLEK